MQQKDFILRQIEMLSLIPLRLTRQLEVSPNENDILVANDSLLKNSNINIQELVLIDKENLKTYLNQKNILTDSFIELSKYLQKIGKFYTNSNVALAEKNIRTYHHK